MIVRLLVDYIGTAYHGWQKQKGLDTVQERLENAVKSLTGQRVCVHGSGRTDAGVHAVGQTAHFELVDTGRSYNFEKGLNHYLPADIRVLDARIERENFHARFSVKKKTYRYLIYESQSDRAVFLNRAMRSAVRLDVDAMNEAAACLEGEHDFASFMSTGSPVKSTVRTVYALEVSRFCGLVAVTVTANGFLYNMVRRIASALIKVGKGDWTPGDVKKVLLALDGTLIKDIVPACGLYLMSVEYDEDKPERENKPQ